MGLHQNKKLLHRKRKHQQNEKGTNHMGKYIVNDTLDKGLKLFLRVFIPLPYDTKTIFKGIYIPLI